MIWRMFPFGVQNMNPMRRLRLLGGERSAPLPSLKSPLCQPARTECVTSTKLNSLKIFATSWNKKKLYVLTFWISIQSFRFKDKHLRSLYIPCVCTFLALKYLFNANHLDFKFEIHLNVNSLTFTLGRTPASPWSSCWSTGSWGSLMLID